MYTYTYTLQFLMILPLGPTYGPDATIHWIYFLKIVRATYSYCTRLPYFLAT